MNDANLHLDEPRSIRNGEELPVEKLRDYLCKQLGKPCENLVIEQFPSGFSNLTYLLRLDDDQLVLRRPPIGANIKSAHDMKREYSILSKLHLVFQKVPKPVILCEDESVVGMTFYVMERVHGVILRATTGREVQLSPGLMLSLSGAFIDNLAEIHNVDYQRAGLGEFGHPDGYVARQIEGWTRRYFNSRTDDVRSIENIASWLSGQAASRSSGSALIHNDYKYDNLVLSPDDLTQVIAILDWEMATIGDPLMDLGTSLAYWVDADDPPEWRKVGFGPTTLPGNLQRAELVHRYAQKTGSDVSEIVFPYVYGLLKIAVIVQQIYYRYRKGITKDPRFSGLLDVVHACGVMAERAVELQRIANLG
jgi:aminoglycoside phosphotransferase (APT) family kinase protein